jgi:hypothetical protein
MSEITWIQGVTLFIAVWGAFLSTYKILSDRKSSKRNVTVKVTTGIISQGCAPHPFIINISAINMGLRDVTLKSVGFLLPNGKEPIIMAQNTTIRFPYTLPEGNECTVSKFRFKLAKELKQNGFSGKVKLRGYYQGATGEYYKSKPHAFDIDSPLNNYEVKLNGQWCC